MIFYLCHFIQLSLSPPLEYTFFGSPFIIMADPERSPVYSTFSAFSLSFLTFLTCFCGFFAEAEFRRNFPILGSD